MNPRITAMHIIDLAKTEVKKTQYSFRSRSSKDKNVIQVTPSVSYNRVKSMPGSDHHAEPGSIIPKKRKT